MTPLQSKAPMDLLKVQRLWLMLRSSNQDNLGIVLANEILFSHRFPVVIGKVSYLTVNDLFVCHLSQTSNNNNLPTPINIPC